MDLILAAFSSILTSAPDRNPKAFTFSNPGKLLKSNARSADVRTPEPTALYTSVD